MDEPTPEARAIAQGDQATWSGTFTHPEHGELTFRVPQMPRVKDWLEHAQMQQQIAAGLTGADAVLAAACAGMLTFIEVPVIREDRQEDPDDATHDKITKVYYNPLDEEDIGFPVKVWVDFVDWRLGVVSDKTKEQVKNSFAGTSGEQDSEPSPASTESPQPTGV